MPDLSEAYLRQKWVVPLFFFFSSLGRFPIFFVFRLFISFFGSLFMGGGVRARDFFVIFRFEKEAIQTYHSFFSSLSYTFFQML